MIPKSDSSVKLSKHGISLQTRLVAFIILTVLTVSIISVFFDYRCEYNQHINVILASLEEHARILQVSRTRITEPSAFAKYVDDFCAQMNDFTSPGHHILILDRTGAVTVSAQHHSGVELSLTGQVASIVSEAIQNDSSGIEDDATIVAFEVLPKATS